MRSTTSSLPKEFRATLERIVRPSNRQGMNRRVKRPRADDLPATTASCALLRWRRVIWCSGTNNIAAGGRCAKIKNRRPRNRVTDAIQFRKNEK
jgi:hypothetical protein